MELHRRTIAPVIAVGLVLVACASGATISENPTTTVAGDPVTTLADPTTTTAAPSTTSSTEAPDTATIDPVVFRQAMRVLWEDHVAWTRLFIVSAVADLPDTEATAGRLLQNQTDIGNAVAAFYGDEAGTALTALLNDHILLAGDIITAAKASDDAAMAEANDLWYQNADEISVFLAAANPAWPEDTLKSMMRVHLDQTLAEATAQLTGDYAASVAEYDHIVTHILEMADVLSAGIISQFPDQFSS